MKMMDHYGQWQQVSEKTCTLNKNPMVTPILVRHSSKELGFLNPKSQLNSTVVTTIRLSVYMFLLLYVHSRGI